MVNLKKLFILVAGVILWSSCQKEFIIDWGVGGKKADATLKDTAGSCSPIVVRGVYSKGKTLSDSNYFLIPVTVVSEGSYLIFSNLVNGFHFRDSGVLNNIGSQTVKVRAAGMPAVATSTDFTLVLGASVCTFSVTVTD